MYDGDGRFFDPALGVYVQPDPFGGALEAPESLNRYAAAGVSTLPTLGSIPTRNVGRNYWDFVVELGSTALNKIFGNRAENRWTPAVLSSLRLSTFGKTIARDHFVHLSVSWPDLGITGRRIVGEIRGGKHVNLAFQRVILGETYIDVESGSLFNVKRAFLDPAVEEMPVGRIGSGPLAKLFRAGVLDNALPFFVDFVWQFGTDLGTDMPVGYRIGRAGVAGSVGVIAGGLTVKAVGVGWGILTAAGLVSGAVPPLLIIGAGVVVGLTVERWVVDRINDWLFPVDS